MIKIKPWGDYPDGYKPEVHGPFHPGRWYGKPDTPFGQVKLSELPAWLGRKSWMPNRVCAAIARSTWRYMDKYHFCKHINGVGFNQIVVLSAITFYTLNCYKFAIHRHAKYH